MEELLSDGNGTDGVLVTPDQKNGDIDSTKLGCKVGIVGGKPIGEIRLLVFESLPPVDRTKAGSVKASGSGNHHQVGDEVWPAKCRLDGKHATHGLSNQCSGAINPRYGQIHEIFEAGDGGICRYPSKSWISHEGLVYSKLQLAREWFPKVAISKSSRKKEYLRWNG